MPAEGLLPLASQEVQLSAPANCFIGHFFILVFSTTARVELLPLRVLIIASFGLRV